MLKTTLAFAGSICPLVPLMPLVLPGMSIVSVPYGAKEALGWNANVLGDGWVHFPGTAGESDGIGPPLASGAEKVTEIPVFGATLVAPGAGVVDVILREGRGRVATNLADLDPEEPVAPARDTLPAEVTTNAPAATTAIPARMNNDTAPLWLFDRP